jgi:hypothetical protein
MRTGLIPITFALAFACGGASDEEVREAQAAGYQGDFAVIYSETLAAVRELYPELSDEPRIGMIRTAWHPVNVQQGGQEEPSRGSNPNPTQGTAGLQATADSHEPFFIRFDVHVVGGRPWHVRVRGEASKWAAGDAIPSPLRGPEVPHWLQGRTNALEVAIHKRLRKYAVGGVKARHDGAARDAPAASTPAAKPLDVARFGQLPAGAGLVVATAEAAARSQDVARLRALMADQFTYSTGDPPSADTAVIVWQADPSLLAELAKALEAGCAGDKGGARVVCPAAALTETGFSGYRAAFQARGKAWRMVSFFTGD